MISFRIVQLQVTQCNTFLNNKGRKNLFFQTYLITNKRNGLRSGRNTFDDGLNKKDRQSSRIQYKQFRLKVLKIQTCRICLCIFAMFIYL